MLAMSLFARKKQAGSVCFSLKTALDDFKNMSTKLHILLIDFGDAYGSIKYDKMIQTLNKYDIPATYFEIIKDIHEGACFQVICVNTLSETIYITRSTTNRRPILSF